jgi:Na+/melibiose symporter-like transporter
MGVLWRLLIPIIMLAVLLPERIGGIVMVAAFFMMSLCQHLSNPGYNAWMVSSTKGLINQDFYSHRDMVFMPLYTLFTLFAGILINTTEANGNLKFGFIIYGVVVLAFSLTSLPFLMKKLPKPKVSTQTQKQSIFKCVSLTLKDKPYLKVLLFHITWTFFSVLWSNFASIYQIRVLKLNYLFVTVSITAASVLRIVCIPIFSKFAKRFSWKTATLVSMGIMAVHCISWSLTTAENSAVMFPITTILGTIPWAAMGIGMFKYQIAYTTEETRSVYFSVNSTLCGIIAFFAGIVSSGLVEFFDVMFEVSPFWIIFVIGFVGVVITWLIIFKTPYSEPDGK